MSTRSRRTPPPPASQAQRTARAIDPQRADRCAEATRVLAGDATIVSDALMTGAYGQMAPAAELLAEFISLRRLSEEGIAAIVVRQRSEGKPLDDLADMLGLSVDRLRKKYVPQQVDQQLAARSRPQHRPNGLTTSAGPPDPRLLRHPRQRLACALTLTVRGSGLSQRALADQMGFDSSYVSRLLSGHREASLPHVKRICEVCHGDTDLVQALWNATLDVPRASDHPARDLRTYLNALRYAAGSPSEESILASAQHAFTALDLRQAFKGPGIPSWKVVRQLAVALQSMPEATLPLWQRANARPDTCSAPAEAFG